MGSSKELAIPQESVWEFFMVGHLDTKGLLQCSVGEQPPRLVIHVLGFIGLLESSQGLRVGWAGYARRGSHTAI